MSSNTYRGESLLQPSGLAGSSQLDLAAFTKSTLRSLCVYRILIESVCFKMFRSMLLIFLTDSK